MPHLTIQHTANVHIERPIELLDTLNNCLWQTGEFSQPEELKSRIIPLADFLVGTNQKMPNSQSTDGFVFLQLQIMSGRNDSVKQKFAETLAQSTKAILSPQQTQKIQICVEVQELSSNYAKIVL